MISFNQHLIKIFHRIASISFNNPYFSHFHLCTYPNVKYKVQFMLLYIQTHLVYKFTQNLQSLHTRKVILNLI